VITRLIKYWEKKSYPEEWKMAIVCPICKTEGKIRENNYYRGVSLLPVAEKMFSGSWLLDRVGVASEQ